MVSYGSAATCAREFHKDQVYVFGKQPHTHNKILVGLVGRLSFLLPCAHEPSPRYDAGLDLGKMDLHHHALFASISIPHLGNTVPWSTNFKENLSLNVTLSRCNHQLRLLEVTSRTSGKISLMLLPLRVCQIRALVRMQGEAKTTFQRAKMVAKDVWVLKMVEFISGNDSVED